MASKRIHQLTIHEFERQFPDEEACIGYLVKHHWPEKVSCPRCGSEHVYSLKTMPYKWECMNCAPGISYRFSHLTGTIFENTNKPLRDWFRVFHMMVTNKKRVAALEVFRVMGFGSYKTAWYMCHRIRVAMQDKEFHKLMGIVEVDETFVGRKTKNRHKDKRGKGGGTGGTGSGKAAVVGAIRRKGNIVARVVANVQAATLISFVRETVSTKVSLLVTDQWVGYQHLGAEYPHAVIDHAKGQYVVGAVHTNTIEGFWSLIKRGVVGTYHKTTKKYLPLYFAEFQFRYNNRSNPDIFGAAIMGC